MNQNKMEVKKEMGKFDLVFKIECVSEFIANSVRENLEKELKRLYRAIIVKSEVVEHPILKGVLDLSKKSIEKEKRIEAITKEINDLQKELEVTHNVFTAVLLSKKYSELETLGYEYNVFTQELIIN